MSGGRRRLSPKSLAEARQKLLNNYSTFGVYLLATVAISALIIELVVAAVVFPRLLIAGFDLWSAAWQSFYYAASAFTNTGFTPNPDGLQPFTTDPVSQVPGVSYTDPADVPFWWERGALTAWPVVPLTLSESVRRRVSRLGTDGRAVLVAYQIYRGPGDRYVCEDPGAPSQ